MPFYQMDSSAAVKLYVSEVGSTWIRALVDPTTGNTISIAEITRAEIGSALARRVREGLLTQATCVRLVQTSEANCLVRFRSVPTGNGIVKIAVDLAQRHPLRAYDAIQLATALHVNRDLTVHRLPARVFASGDDRLLAAAQAEGLATDNPNDHP